MRRDRRPTVDAQTSHSVTDVAAAFVRAFEAALHLPQRPASRWHRAGVGHRTERVLNVLFGALLLTFAAGWTWSIAEARAAQGPLGDARTPATSAITAALTNADAPSIAYLTDAAIDVLTPLRGESGRLKAVVGERGALVVEESLPPGASVAYASVDDSADAVSVDSARRAASLGHMEGTADTATAGDSTRLVVAPDDEGVWTPAIRVGSVLKEVADFRVITLTPLSRRQRGRIGLYYIGTWPTERGRKKAGYETPSGFIEVTQENRDTPVSDHFALGDFLTKGQESVWPKYLVLDMRLVDKLELVLLDLQQRGYVTNGVQVMSGFRTPQYNVRGGDPRGRASLSRHMYGDASDIFIDNDGNGWMDDLNRDGKVDIKDAEVIQAAVDRVEQEHPNLVGGSGVYVATSGHGPFIHIDVRGYRARWIGTGDS